MVRGLQSGAAAQSGTAARENSQMKRLLLTMLIAVQIGFAGSKLSPDLPTSGWQLVEVIVQFKTTASTNGNNGNNGNNSHTQQGDWNNNVNQVGWSGQIKAMWPNLNAVHMQLPVWSLQFLASIPQVAYISPNRTLKRTLDITTQAVNANLAWNFGWDGTGVGVAVIDSGITPKHDLTGAGGNSRVVYSQSFISGVSDPTDGYGHGTHVAGIIGSRGIDSTGSLFSRTFKGVAPNVNLIDLRVLDQNGAGQEADVINAIQTAIALKNTYNIRVINLSMGRPVFESYTLDPLCQAVEAAWQAGIVVVTAAGNSGRDNSLGTHGFGTIVSPGNDPYVITVGAANTHGTASRNDDTVASYSSKGPTLVDHIVKPDIVAPGNGIVSLLASTNATLYQAPGTRVAYTFYEANGSGYSQNYLRLSGTSMATPVVAGAAALLIQKNPNLTPDQVKARLMKTAGKILPQHSVAVDSISLLSFANEADIFTVGAGYLDINAALGSTDLVTMPALSPTVVYNATTKHVTVVRSAWGDSVVWGDSAIWGSGIFLAALDDGFSVVWGDSTVVWSADDSGGGFSVVWGDTVSLSMVLTALSDGDSDQ
jgi:serine protease AprX